MLALTAGVLATARVRDVRVRPRHRSGPRRRHRRADLGRRALADRARAHGGGDRAAVPVVAAPSPAGVVVAGVRARRCRCCSGRWRRSGSGLFFQASTTFGDDLRAARRDRRAPALGAAVVDRDPLRRRGRRAARGGARRGVAPRDERKVEEPAIGAPALAGLPGYASGECRSTTGSSPRPSAATRRPRSTAVTATAPRGPRATTAQVLVDGAEYFAAPARGAVRDAAPATGCYFTDWQGDPDEAARRARAPRSATVLAELGRSRRRTCAGLLWRSHPELDELRRGQEPRVLARASTRPAGRCCSTSGSGAVAATTRRSSSCGAPIPRDDVAFVGGIDLCHGRRDDADHLGDPQAVELDDEHYGERPPWHDVQLELRGPAVDDVACTFRERWDDPTPARHAATRCAAAAAPGRRAPGRARPARRQSRPAAADGPLRGAGAAHVPGAPARRTRSRPTGERSIARAYLKAFRRARRLVYLEDQYLWSLDATDVLRDALRRATPSC